MKTNLTRKEIAASLAEKLPIPFAHAKAIVDTMLAAMGTTLAAGENIKLSHFGTLVIRSKSPRQGRNPKTGESMTIVKRQMVAFRPSRVLRERMNQ